MSNDDLWDKAGRPGSIDDKESDTSETLSQNNGLNIFQEGFDSIFKKKKRKRMNKIKLIIELDEDKYNYIKKYGTISLCYDYRITSAILNGIPFEEEFEKIKEEIREWYWQADKQKISEDPCVVDAMTDLFIRTVDKHISELKGGSNAE